MTEVPAAEMAAIGRDAGDGPRDGISQVNDFDHPLATQPNLSDRGIALQAALKAGVLGGVAGLIIGVFGIVLAGILAVYFYRREKGLAPSPRIGSRLGAAAGVVSFAIGYLQEMIRIFASHSQQETIEKTLKIVQMFGYSPTDPEIQAGIHRMFTPSILAMGFVLGMIIAMALSALGGAMAAAFFRPGSRL